MKFLYPSTHIPLIKMARSRLPVWLEVLRGNSIDKSRFVPCCKQLAEEEEQKPDFVMASAEYCKENLKDLGKTGWLTRLPEAKIVLREMDQDSMDVLRDRDYGGETEVAYGGIKQRWLVVFSEAACRQPLKTLGRARAREMKKIEIAWGTKSRLKLS